MAGKIRAALIRKEADTYRSQGLHREARDLYAQLLNSSSNIDPKTHGAIQSQIEQIRKAEQENCADDDRRKLSAELLAILKSGWSDTPTESDMLVCAHALVELGCFAAALDEFRLLLLKGIEIDSVLEPVGACLVQLYEPGMLADAIDRLARETRPDPAAADAFRVDLAKQLRRHRRPETRKAQIQPSRPAAEEARRGLTRIWQILKKMLRRG